MEPVEGFEQIRHRLSVRSKGGCAELIGKKAQFRKAKPETVLSISVKIVSGVERSAIPDTI